MREVRASVEVRALIGANKPRELHGDALARYQCWLCNREVRTTGPTSVIVLAYRLFRVASRQAGCGGNHRARKCLA